MGNTRGLFKQIRDTKGTFHAKMGSIKDRNSMDLAEAEDVKKRWQEYTEQQQKKTRSLVFFFKKIRDTKGTFHAKMGSIKARNGMDLTEEEDIKRGDKNTQKNCTKKIFTTQIITMV